MSGLQECVAGAGVGNKYGSVELALFSPRSAECGVYSVCVRRKLVMRAWSVLGLLIGAAMFAAIPISPQVTRAWSVLGLLIGAAMFAAIY